MISQAEISELPLRDKVAIMEVLWSDLSQAEPNITVPQWHKDLLDFRKGEAEKGNAQYIDWEVAKKEISAACK